MRNSAIQDKATLSRVWKTVDMSWLSYLFIPIQLMAFLPFMALPAEAEPSLYRAVYQADYQGLPISAKGIRELQQTENGTYKFTSKAKALFVSLVESTEFQMVSNQIIPIQYQYHRSGIGKNRHTSLHFNWPEMKVHNQAPSQPWELTIPAGTMDKLLYQFKLSQDFLTAYQNQAPWPKPHYIIVDNTMLKHYHFAVIGEEVIETSLGKLNTIKVARVNTNGKRSSTFWLAPQYDFLLIKFHQVETNGKSFKLFLKTAEFNSKPISYAGQ